MSEDKQNPQFGARHDLVLWKMVEESGRQSWIAECRTSRTGYTLLAGAPKPSIEDEFALFGSLIEQHVEHCDDHRKPGVVAFTLEDDDPLIAVIHAYRPGTYRGTDEDFLTARDIILNERGADA
jgi:hypothetical protein